MEQNRKNLTLGAIMVALVAVLGLSAYSFAQDDQSTNDQNPPGGAGQPACHRGAPVPERQQAKEAEDKALAASDYQAWLQAVGADSKIAQEITAEEFSQLVAASKLEQEARAKFEEARKLRGSIGLKPLQKGFGKGGCGHAPPVDGPKFKEN